MNYEELFAIATDGETPYPYQQRLAEGDSLPLVLKIPTGAGKTEAAIHGWLYRRRYHPDPDVRAATPRRLVYCLPMRTLVEQTVERCQGWLDNLGLKDDIEIVTLMGGSTSRGWKLFPERDAIIIGTQDMLLSRALNRGYGSSQFQWPIEFGLLNNDCLWVLDEVQLMANGLPTSAQMAGFRSPDRLSAYGPTHTMWMSATVRPEWLGTYDHPAPANEDVFELDKDEISAGELGKRNTAAKTLRFMEVSGTGQQQLRQLAEKVIDLHKAGTLTLVVVNTVQRAQDIYGQLERQKPKADTVLLHSRFRPIDRQKATEKAVSEPDPNGPGRIVVSTQAIEAGVDISARVLVSDLAPWASMVQRFGRCNRKGEYTDADVFWLDIGERNAAPYEVEGMAASREKLKQLEGQSVSPATLPDAVEPPLTTSVLRRRDLLGLFDTTPDLSGNYLDVSRYVRGSDETDVQVFWRKFEGSEPSETESQPSRPELCGVPIGQFRRFLSQAGADRRAWRWDFLANKWNQARPSELVPGQTLLMKSESGGYDVKLGWTGDRTEVERASHTDPTERHDSMDAEPQSLDQKNWVTLERHSQDVHGKTARILSSLEALDIPDEIAQATLAAALYHDAGKAHHPFQDTMLSNLDENECRAREGVVWAKRGQARRTARRGHGKRIHFRHEIASALSVLQNAPPELVGQFRDLAAYLAASHHGKVRLSIRSMPSRSGSNPESKQLLGYLTDRAETLGQVDLGGGSVIPETTLDMSLARIGMTEDGQPSWLERTLSLLDWLGPFRLAYLEAVLRAADVRASIDEEKGGDTDD